LKDRNSVSNEIYFPPPNIHHSGLFNHFSQVCNGENPPNANLVRVTASSQQIDNYFGKNVLEWNTKTGWQTPDKKCNGEWIHFDLLGQSFILNELHIWKRHLWFPRVWCIQGSNDNQPPKTTYESNNNNQFNTEDDHPVFLEISNSKPFKAFLFLSKSESFHSNNCIEIHGSESYGTLLE
jgi:hypothetical protein